MAGFQMSTEDPEVLHEAEIADADEGAEKWLTLAKGLDYSARILMQFALRSAGQHAASQAEPWVELARHAGAGAAEQIVVRFILENEDDTSISKGDASLRDRIARLESFATLTHSVAAELRAQLGSDDAQEG